MNKLWKLFKNGRNLLWKIWMSLAYVFEMIIFQTFKRTTKLNREQSFDTLQQKRATERNETCVVWILFLSTITNEDKDLYVFWFLSYISLCVQISWFPLSFFFFKFIFCLFLSISCFWLFFCVFSNLFANVCSTASAIDRACVKIK